LNPSNLVLGSVLAAELGTAVSFIPSTLYALLPLPSVNMTVSAVIGPPHASLSCARLLSPSRTIVSSEVQVLLSMYDLGGFPVVFSESVLKYISVSFNRSGSPSAGSGSELQFGSVTGFEAAGSSTLLRIQLLKLGDITISVAVSDVWLSSDELVVSVLSPACEAARYVELNEPRLACVCMAGFYLEVLGGECIPCPIGSYNPDAGNSTHSM
jgi:hypothetical protein